MQNAKSSKLNNLLYIYIKTQQIINAKNELIIKIIQTKGLFWPSQDNKLELENNNNIIPNLHKYSCIVLCGYLQIDDRV